MDSARPRGRTRRKAVSCALAVRRETDGTSNLWVSRPSSKKGVSIRIFLRVRLKTSARVTKLSQHEADGGEFQEREGIAVEIFPVLGEAAATIEPGNRAFDDPTLG